MYRCIAIDDEEYAISGLKEYISMLPDLELVHTFTDPIQALREISTGSKMDIIFMDVDMPLISGIELSKALRNKTDKLVFTTCHSKYAFEAFEVDADAFLLKPYTFAKFAQTINKMFPGKPAFPEQVRVNDDFFFVKNKEDNLKLVKVKYDDIIAIESIQNYIRVYTPIQKIVAYLSLTEITNHLKSMPRFVQVQRSFIVSTPYIESVEGNTINLSNNLQITVGQHYKEQLQKIIKQKTIKTDRK